MIGHFWGSKFRSDFSATSRIVFITSSFFLVIARSPPGGKQVSKSFARQSWKDGAYFLHCFPSKSKHLILQGLGLVQASATEQNKTKKRQKILDQYSFSAIKKISTNNFFQPKTISTNIFFSQNLLTTFFGGQKNL